MGPQVGADIRAEHMEVGFITDRTKRTNHDEIKVPELLAVPRYADLVEEDRSAGSSEEENEVRRPRAQSGLVRSRVGWRKEMKKWIREEREHDSDDNELEHNELANHLYGRQRST